MHRIWLSLKYMFWFFCSGDQSQGLVYACCENPDPQHAARKSCIDVKPSFSSLPSQKPDPLTPLSPCNWMKMGPWLLQGTVEEIFVADLRESTVVEVWEFQTDHGLERRERWYVMRKGERGGRGEGAGEERERERERKENQESWWLKRKGYLEKRICREGGKHLVPRGLGWVRSAEGTQRYWLRESGGQSAIWYANSHFS